MRSRLLLLVPLLLVAVSLHAQVGSGPAPPPSTPTADKYQKVSFTESVSCSVASPCTHNIYRGTSAGGPFGRINATPFSGTSYQDGTTSTPPPAFGVVNFYVVTAVQGTIESAQSQVSNGAAAVQGNGSVQAPTGLNAVLAFLLTVGKDIFAALKAVGSFFG